MLVGRSEEGGLQSTGGERPHTGGPVPLRWGEGVAVQLGLSRSRCLSAGFTEMGRK